MTILAGISFHKHLEKCEQCMNNPFGLCPVGLKLLQDGAKEIDNGGFQPPVKDKA